MMPGIYREDTGEIGRELYSKERIKFYYAQCNIRMGSKEHRHAIKKQTYSAAFV